MKRKSNPLSRYQRPSNELLPFEAPDCVLYAIELDRSVTRDPAFAAKNPRWIPGMPIFYIGLTSLKIEERYAQHILGTKNVSRIAHQFGGKLRMDIVPDRKPTRRTWALKMEQRLTNDLRARGFGAWMG